MGQQLMHVIPFGVSIAVYFWVLIPMEQQTIVGMVLKCWPIITLQYFVYMHDNGLNNDGSSSYKNKILAGLILSSVGDAFLDFPGYFLHGTVSFAFAQICYIWTFGFQPLNVLLGIKVFTVLSIPLYYIMENLMKEDILTISILTLYAPLLKTMVWRSIARTQITTTQTTDSGKDWGKTFGRIGGISFGISDATLAINKYYSPIPYAQVIIMLTYYIAQCGISLSVIQPESRRIESNRRGKKT